MPHLLCALLVLIALPVTAQHDGHGTAAAERHGETTLVNGLRIDPADPPPGSAVGRAMAFVGDTYVHVAYSRPFKRGRMIFGGLVGYGQVWMMGAHYATEIVLTGPLRVGGETLAAGVYSLSATPEADAWTLHFNSVLGMHGTDLYDPAHDVLTVRVPVETLPDVTEQFTIDFAPAGDAVDLRVTWDQTRIHLPLRPAH